MGTEPISPVLAELQAVRALHCWTHCSWVEAPNTRGAHSRVRGQCTPAVPSVTSRVHPVNSCLIDRSLAYFDSAKTFQACCMFHTGNLEIWNLVRPGKNTPVSRPWTSDRPRTQSGLLGARLVPSETRRGERYEPDLAPEHIVSQSDASPPSGESPISPALEAFAQPSLARARSLPNQHWCTGACTGAPKGRPLLSLLRVKPARSPRPRCLVILTRSRTTKSVTLRTEDSTSRRTKRH